MVTPTKPESEKVAAAFQKAAVRPVFAGKWMPKAGWVHAIKQTTEESYDDATVKRGINFIIEQRNYRVAADGVEYQGIGTHLGQTSTSTLYSKLGLISLSSLLNPGCGSSGTECTRPGSLRN